MACHPKQISKVFPALVTVVKQGGTGCHVLGLSVDNKAPNS